MKKRYYKPTITMDLDKACPQCGATMEFRTMISATPKTTMYKKVRDWEICPKCHYKGGLQKRKLFKFKSN